MPDVREQLYDAAHRVLLRDGPDALTSRAVTTEAGVAKGILHRHFADFDGFLASLVLLHVERLDRLSPDLRASAGSGTVQANVADALAAALTPEALAVVSLVMSRHPLLARLRLTTPTGIPLLTETVKMIAGYLTAERGLGRIPLETEVDGLALLLVGGAHLQTAGRAGSAPDLEQLRNIVSSTITAEDGPRVAGKSDVPGAVRPPRSGPVTASDASTEQPASGDDASPLTGQCMRRER
jgi:AcrR family transcriptional regulator